VTRKAIAAVCRSPWTAFLICGAMGYALGEAPIALRVLGLVWSLALGVAIAEFGDWLRGKP
jgi:hypothetical protein